MKWWGWILTLHLGASSILAVTINEFVPNTGTEWVEFHNSSESAEFIKSYYLDDDTSFDSDSGSSSKRLLTNLNTSNVTYPYFDLTSSVFNNSGDMVVLFDSAGSLVDQYTYSSDPGDNVSIGRSPDGSGSYFLLSSTTKGAPNSFPPPSPTPTPTPTLTPTPTPTPTVKPSPTPTPTPTPKSSPTPTPRLSPSPSASTATPTPKSVSTAPPASAVVAGAVSGPERVKWQEPSASPQVLAAVAPGPPRLGNWLAVGVMVGGGGIFGLAVYLLWRRQRRVDTMER